MTYHPSLLFMRISSLGPLLTRVSKRGKTEASSFFYGNLKSGVNSDKNEPWTSMSVASQPSRSVGSLPVSQWRSQGVWLATVWLPVLFLVTEAIGLLVGLSNVNSGSKVKIEGPHNEFRWSEMSVVVDVIIPNKANTVVTVWMERSRHDLCMNGSPWEWMKFGLMANECPVQMICCSNVNWSW